MADREQERTRVTREEWAKRVERWRESGLTCAEFSAELGINARTLTYWKWVLGKEARGEKRTWPKRQGPSSRAKRAPTTIAPAESRGLIEIQVAPSSDARIELELRSGRRLRIPAGFDPQGLKQLLDLLEAR
jgi:hypothetical protein